LPFLTLINRFCGTFKRRRWFLSGVYHPKNLTVMKNLFRKDQNKAQKQEQVELNVPHKERQQMEIEKAQREAQWKMQIFSHV